jgi:hypothetical protein
MPRLTSICAKRVSPAAIVMSAARHGHDERLLALGGEEHARPHLGIGVGRLERARQAVQHPDVEGVALRRAPGGARPGLSGAAGGALLAPEAAKTGPQGARSAVDQRPISATWPRGARW